MAEMHIQEKDGTLTLKVQGPMSIIDATTLRSLLLEALSSRRDLSLDLSGADSIDLSCVQVLCSAHRTFSRVNMKIVLCTGMPQGIVNAIATLGLSPETCTDEPHGECLWALRR